MRMKTGHQLWWEAILDQMVCGKGDDSQNGVGSRQEGTKEVETVSLDNSLEISCEDKQRIEVLTRGF